VPALHWSRRRLLRAGTVALAAAVAGCGDDAESETTPRDPGSGPPPGAITDPETRSLRRETSSPFVYLDSGEDADEDPSETLFLVDPADADALAFEAPVPDGAVAVRSFVKSTDFDSETVVIVQRAVSACYRRQTEYVIPEEGRFEVRFCGVLRDADVACDAEERHMVATVVRVPRAYETPPDDRRYGAGSRCESASWESTHGEDAG